MRSVVLNRWIRSPTVFVVGVIDTPPKTERWIKASVILLREKAYQPIISKPDILPLPPVAQTSGDCELFDPTNLLSLHGIPALSAGDATVHFEAEGGAHEREGFADQKSEVCIVARTGSASGGKGFIHFVQQIRKRL